MMGKNIQIIVDNALCTGCGGCCGVCPAGAITMVTNIAGYIVPRVDAFKCNECSICCDICPSVDQNTPWNEGNDLFHGVSIKGYIGHAIDKEIRQKAQSGGIVTALLCYLLDRKKIDGAIVNGFNEDTRRPEVVCRTSRDEIIQSAGSYYTQSSVVQEILRNQDKRTAAVVLGCQSECLNLIRKRHLNFKMPDYVIGLFCAGQYSGNYIDTLIRGFGIDNEKVTGFRFRDKSAGGWPGNIKIYTNGRDYVFESSIRHILKPVYGLHRCLLCFDQMNIFSDIVVGDPWGISAKVDRAGNSVIITRTEKGETLIEEAKREGVIDVETLELNSIYKGQTVDSRAKTQFFTSAKIASEKGFLLPIALERFDGTSYIQASPQKFAEIYKRLIWTRSVFMEKNAEKYQKVISNKERSVKIVALAKKFMTLPKRLVKYILKKCKK